MKQIWILANLTFKEGIRNRALFGITIVALMMLTATIILTGLFAHELGKVMMDLIFSTIAFSGLLLTFFVNINLMEKDIDKRTIYGVLSKPVSRTEYVLGKYLGLMILIFTALGFLLLFSAGIALVIKSITHPNYFRDFSWLCFFQAFFYELLMFMILNAVLIFFSSITTSSFLTLLFSVSVYITGQSIEEVVDFFKHEAARSGVAPSPLNSFIVDFLQYIFPNLSAFDIKTLAAHGRLLPLDHTLIVFGYGLIYTTLLLFFATIIFKRRELN
jgi:ABC-type transport system involved in multi-copper enzyme maturation permease subunit